MIASELQQGWWPAWDLFGDAIVVGLVLGALLPLVGVVLVLRQQMFVTAAIGQAANFGVAVVIWSGVGSAHAVGHAAASEAAALGGGLLVAIAAAVVALRALSVGASTLEAGSVFVFVGAGSGAMVLLADVPHGLAEVQRLMLSSLSCVGSGDVQVVAGFAAVALVALARVRRRLVLWAMDPQAAAAYGTPAWRYDLAVGAFVGGVLGWSLYVAGLIYTFACAVLPVLAAREIAGSLGAVLRLAPLLGAVGAAVGLSVGHRCDLPAGQTTALALVLLVACARALGSRSRR